MTGTLTEDQAYRAMVFFLRGQWERTGSADIAALLGDLSLLPDGRPADPAVADDFREAIARAKGSEAIGLDLPPSR
ncbi:hypothetical protein [Phreatobacter sp.]|uniref:hypothetical protein n=1 Tax=Phreatobacter sp. TaxID=1966341 RepID=UPI003F6EF7BF